MTSLLEQAERVRAAVEELEERARKELVGKDARIGRGEYAGRLGRIMAVAWFGELTAMCRPYNLWDPGELLWGRPDARMFWPLSSLALQPHVGIIGHGA